MLTIVDHYKQTEEWVTMLHLIYESSSVDTVPSLDLMYQQFKKEWTEMTTEFLIANKDSWKISEQEFEFLEDNLHELGFICPTYEQIEQVLQVDEMSYRTYDGQCIRMAVKSVW